MRRVMVYMGLSLILGVSAASAAPDAAARDKYKAAQKLAADDDNDAALALVDQGLKIASKDLDLLQLRGELLLKTRDYTGALAAYQAYLDAGARGANRREAQKIVNSLGAVKTTFVDLTSSAPATVIYLDTKTAGVFCTAPCKKALLPDDYKVIAERPGFDRFTTRLTVKANTTTALAIAMVEKPSPLAVKVSPAGATIMIGGKPLDAAGTSIPAGKHEVVIKLAGHATHKSELAAHEGKPIELAVELFPLVPIELSPPGATLELDGKPTAIENGGVPVPPGAHTLIAKAPAFHDTRIEIPGTRAAGYKLVAKLAEIGTRVEIAHAPSGAKIVVDGKTVATTPLNGPIEVPPGKHTIEVKASGYRPYRTTGTFLVDHRARLSIDKLRRDDRRRTLIAGISTGVAFAAAGIFSLTAISKQDQFDARARVAGVTPDDPQLQDFRRQGQGASRIADIGYALGIVGAGATVYLFLSEGRGESQGSLKIGVGPAGAMARLKF